MNTMTATSGSIVSFETWLAAITSSACIGCTSLVPWLFNMTFFEHKNQANTQPGIQRGNSRMDYLLSFSVGAILGDIFFHLIPESLDSHLVEFNDSPEVAQKKVGSSIIAGILMFIIIEMILEKWSNQRAEDDCTELIKNCDESTVRGELSMKQDDVDQLMKNENLKRSQKSCEKLGDILENNNNIETSCEECSHDRNWIESKKNNQDISVELNLSQRKKKMTLNVQEDQNPADYASPLNATTEKTSGQKLSASLISGQAIDPAGYLNLIANGCDNFTHGLAIGASFLVGPKVGLLTTFVIFIHEIPHEICDYAILVNSGFSRWDAVKAQSSVSLFGIMGTATALYVKSVETLTARTVWILPFSAGGFLHIALVNLLPEILSRETNFRGSFEQISCVILGIAFMGAVALA